MFLPFAFFDGPPLGESRFGSDYHLSGGPLRPLSAREADDEGDAPNTQGESERESFCFLACFSGRTIPTLPALLRACYTTSEKKKKLFSSHRINANPAPYPLPVRAPDIPAHSLLRRASRAVI